MDISSLKYSSSFLTSYSCARIFAMVSPPIPTWYLAYSCRSSRFFWLVTSIKLNLCTGLLGFSLSSDKWKRSIYHTLACQWISDAAKNKIFRLLSMICMEFFTLTTFCSTIFSNWLIWLNSRRSRSSISSSTQKSYSQCRGNKNRTLLSFGSSRYRFSSM